MRSIPRSCLAVVFACAVSGVGCTETIDASPKDAATEPDVLSLSLRLDGAARADTEPVADADPATDGAVDEAVDAPADGAADDAMPPDDAGAIDGGDADGQNEG